MSKQPWNMLEAENAIIERLKFATQTEQNGIMPWCCVIASGQQMTQIEQTRQTVPAIYVIYQGETPLDSNISMSIDGHKWLIVLAVSNASAQRSAQPLNNEAGVYIPRVKSALKGFVVPGTMEAIKPVAPPPPFYETSFAYYPLAYQARVLFSSGFGVGASRATTVNKPFTPTTINK